MPRVRTVSVTEAARNFADLVNRAYYKDETILLLKNGTPVEWICAKCSTRGRATFAWQR